MKNQRRPGPRRVAAVPLHDAEPLLKGQLALIIALILSMIVTKL